MNGEIYNSWNHYNYATGETGSYSPSINTSRKQTSASSNSILAIQQKLNKLGYKGKNGKSLVEDGIWGTNTAYAHDAYTLDVRKQTAQQKQAASDPLNAQLKQLADSIPNNTVPKPLASSSHVQSVLKDNTRSQQEKEDIAQRAMDPQPDYLAGLRELLDDTKPKKSPQDELLELLGQKVPESVSSSSHVQSVLKDNTLSQQEQEARLQRAMDAIQTKADERERARKSANPLDAILYYNNDPGKSQTERQEDYMRALQHLLQPGQTESEYRQEYRYLDTINRTAENNKNRYLSYQKALDQKLNQSSDPLYVLERSLKRYSPTQYSQEELGQIYDRAAKQIIIPFGFTESGYRQRAVLREALAQTSSQLPEYTDAEWQKTAYNLRIDGANLKNWGIDGDASNPNNCYYWALKIWTRQGAYPTISTDKHGPGVFIGDEVSSTEISAVFNSDWSYDEKKLDALTHRLGNNFIADAEAVGYNARLMTDQLMALNITGYTSHDMRAEYQSMEPWEQSQSEIGRKKKLGQKVEERILENLAPDETLIVMAITPDNKGDTIHFYRRDPDGTWTEKPGKDPVKTTSSPFTTPEVRTDAGQVGGAYKIISAFAIS